MREFKFRGYSKTLGMSESFTLKWLAVNSTDVGEFNVIMQYTGLKDKSGKEIYESDIYTQGDKNIKYIVEWHDSGLMGRQYDNQSYAGLSYWRERIEVIGNVYENPEKLR